MTDPGYPSFQVCFPEDWTESSVIGRNCGSELSVGMVFDRIASVVSVAEGDAVFCKDRKIEDNNMNLAIEKIEAYGRFLDTLSSGMTARLYLKGDGMDRLRALERSGSKAKHYHLETGMA